MNKINIVGLLLAALFVSNTSFANNKIATKLYDGKTHLDDCILKAKTILEGKFIQKPSTSRRYRYRHRNYGNKNRRSQDRNNPQRK
jgi:hypothetical protein